MKLVVIESPYAGDIEANVQYARQCVRDSLKRGEAPYASHLFFTQPELLDDQVQEERTLGIQAGLAWGMKAHRIAVYLDRGLSAGMQIGLVTHLRRGKAIALRSLGRPDCDSFEVNFPRPARTGLNFMCGCGMNERLCTRHQDILQRFPLGPTRS